MPAIKTTMQFVELSVAKTPYQIRFSAGIIFMFHCKSCNF
jgi:hypothetical protein